LGVEKNMGYRMLKMYGLISRGEPLKKSLLMDQFGITAKTFQRDLEDLREYLAETGGGTIKYSKTNNEYRLSRNDSAVLSQQEMLGLCKILIESRAFNKAEFVPLIQKLLLQLPGSSRKAVEDLIRNERHHYIALQHGKPLLNAIWDLSGFIKQQQMIRICYVRHDGTERMHSIKPAGIMFSEFYFYFIAYIDGKDKPTVFRIDRIQSYAPAGGRFSVPYGERFSEAEFRKRVQFMFAGDLRRVKFIYKGALEAVLDRLPSSQVVGQSNDGYPIVAAEVFGTGIDAWIRAQGELVETL